MLPEWASKYEDDDHIVKKRGNKYFLYEYEIIYEQISNDVYEMYSEPIRKLSRTHTARILPDRLIINKKKSKPKKREDMISYPKEYGASTLIDILCSDILHHLKKCFHDDAIMMYVMAKQILIGQPSFEKLHMTYRKSYDCLIYKDLEFSIPTILSLLNKLTHNRVGRYRFVHTYMNHENYVIFTDTYCLKAQSIQILFCFQDHTLTYFRSFHIDQSIEETIRHALIELKSQNVIWMGSDNIFIHDMPYIIHVHYDKPMDHHDQYFIYHDRHVYYETQDKLILYDDEAYTIYHHGHKMPLALWTNVDIDVKDIYTMYMNKKNIQDTVYMYYDLLEDNHNYIQDHNEVGFMFVYYLSMLMYHCINVQLKDSNLSVYEVIDQLKKVKRQMVQYQWQTNVDNLVGIDKIKEAIPECEKM